MVWGANARKNDRFTITDNTTGERYHVFKDEIRQCLLNMFDTESVEVRKAIANVVQWAYGTQELWGAAVLGITIE